MVAPRRQLELNDVREEIRDLRSEVRYDAPLFTFTEKSRKTREAYDYLSSKLLALGDLGCRGCPEIDPYWILRLHQLTARIIYKSEENIIRKAASNSLISKANKLYDKICIEIKARGVSYRAQFIIDQLEALKSDEL